MPLMPRCRFRHCRRCQLFFSPLRCRCRAALFRCCHYFAADAFADIFTPYAVSMPPITAHRSPPASPIRPLIMPLLPPLLMMPFDAAYDVFFYATPRYYAFAFFAAAEMLFISAITPLPDTLLLMIAMMLIFATPPPCHYCRAFRYSHYAAADAYYAITPLMPRCFYY